MIDSIIYEDQDILVCRKEAGISTQTNQLGQKDMVSIIKNYRVEKKEEPYVGVVHRLDQPVEGVMVFAKNQKSAALLSKQMSEHNIEKQYYAVVWGNPKEDSAVLEDYLLRDGKLNTSKVVNSKIKGAKYAKLTYDVIERKEDKCLLKITLHTGRHHQIRVQLANHGFPIVGDRKYSEKKATGYMPLALCSFRLCFAHPTNKTKLEYVIEPSGIGFCDFFQV